MTRSVVIYSTSHFNPSGDDVLFPTSSAAVIAQAVYAGAARTSDDVIYVDGRDPGNWPMVDGVDVLISTEHALCRGVSHFNPDRSLLVAVNQATRASLRKTLMPVRQGKLPIRAVGRAGDVVSRDPRPAQVAHKILMVGDGVTMGTYTQSGRRLRDLYCSAYGAHVSGAGPTGGARDVVLFPASSIGIRKGSDLLDALCARLSAIDHGPRVVAMGAPSNSYWVNFVRRLERQYSDVFTYVGWMDPESLEFRDLTARALAAIVPSREEGLVGTAIESMARGIPTFVTSQCGLGAIDAAMMLPGDEDLWLDFIASRLTDPSLLERHRVNALVHTQTRFRSADPITRAVARFVDSNRLWPDFVVDPREHGVVITRSGSAGAAEVDAWMEDQMAVELTRRASGDLECHGVDFALEAVVRLEQNPDLVAADVAWGGDAQAERGEWPLALASVHDSSWATPSHVVLREQDGTLDMRLAQRGDAVAAAHRGARGWFPYTILMFGVRTWALIGRVLAEGLWGYLASSRRCRRGGRR